MTREEAINEIRSWDFLNGKEIEAIQTLIPELAESEDEMIRKEIIEFIDTTTLSTDERHHRWIAYLEKQKNLMPPTHVDPCDASWYAYYQRGLNKGYELGLEAGRKEQEPNIELIQRSWYMEGYNEREFFMEPKWILKTGEGGPKYEPNPRYGKSLILGTEPCCCSVNVESEYDKGWRDGHKAGLKDAEMQKPAEWSEEDKKKIYFLSRLIELQVKDEEYCFGEGFRMISKQEAIEMLKSLRPSWKPSEEQMDALAYAIQILDDGLSPKAAKAGEELEHLREQLKKL